jgi:hypothetical protein
MDLSRMRIPTPVLPYWVQPSSVVAVRPLGEITKKTLDPSITKLEALDDVCVKENLEIVNNDYNMGWKPVSDSIAITTIVLGNSHNLI